MNEPNKYINKYYRKQDNVVRKRYLAQNSKE